MLDEKQVLLKLEEEQKYAVESNMEIMAFGIGQAIKIIKDMGKVDVNEKPNTNKLVNQVEQWSKDKNLHLSDPSKQFLKVTEEVGEVAAALARNDMDMLKDGIGDVVVTLIILAQQNGTTLEECLTVAYSEIADRKGKMINGVFVKESDLGDKLK